MGVHWIFRSRILIGVLGLMLGLTAKADPLIVRVEHGKLRGN
jgi:hypothetical protein